MKDTAEKRDVPVTVWLTATDQKRLEAVRGELERVSWVPAVVPRRSTVLYWLVQRALAQFEANRRCRPDRKRPSGQRIKTVPALSRVAGR